MKQTYIVYSILFLIYLLIPYRIKADSFISIDKSNIMLSKGEKTSIKIFLKDAAGRLDIKSENTDIVSTDENKIFLDDSSDEITLEGINIGKTTINILTTDVSTYDYKEINNISNAITVTVYIKGDMNRNGKIDLQDIIILLKKYLKTLETTYEDLIIGDMDENGSIGLKDIILLLRAYLGTN